MKLKTPNLFYRIGIIQEIQTDSNFQTKNMIMNNFKFLSSICIFFILLSSCSDSSSSRTISSSYTFQSSEPIILTSTTSGYVTVKDFKTIPVLEQELSKLHNVPKYDIEIIELKLANVQVLGEYTQSWVEENILESNLYTTKGYSFIQLAELLFTRNDINNSYEHELVDLDLVNIMDSTFKRVDFELSIANTEVANNLFDYNIRVEYKYTVNE